MLPLHLGALFSPLSSNTYILPALYYLAPLPVALVLLYLISPTQLQSPITRVLHLNWLTFAFAGFYNLTLPEASQAVWQYRSAPPDHAEVFGSMVSAAQVYIALVFFGASRLRDIEARSCVLWWGAMGKLWMATLGILSDLGDPLKILERCCGGLVDYGLMTYAALLMGVLMLCEYYGHEAGVSQAGQRTKSQ